MLGADDEEGRIVDALSLERQDHAAQRRVGFLQPVGEDSGRSARAIRVPTRLPVKECVRQATAIGVVFFQLLPYADGLEIHPEQCRHAGSRCSIVVQSLDFVQDSLNFQSVIVHGANDAHRVVESADVGELRRV